MIYPAPPPQQPRKHTTRNVLIIVGIVAVLCCGGAVAGGFALYSAVKDAVGPARETVETFLGHLETGEIDAAYDSLCTGTREQYSREQFTQIVNNRPKLVRHTIVGSNVSNHNGIVSGSVNATLGYADGSSEPHLFQLTKESGNWRVCGQPY